MGDPRDGDESGGEARLYAGLADWWPLLSAPADYAKEAAFYRAALAGACAGPLETLLELGSGGGNNASHLKAAARLTLVDRSPGMLAVSRALNPECEHVEGDMRSVRLDRTFDAVLVHDAVAYMTSAGDLRRAVETAFVHVRPGGAALFAPDWLRETFRPTTDCGGHDGGGRALRYLEWTTDPDPEDSTYTVDYAFLLREGADVRVERDRHVLGLFARAEWLEALADAGFDARTVEYRPADDDRAYELFLGRRPG